MSFFPRTSAELNAMEKPAAMVQPAKNCAYYMDLLQAAEDQKGRILGEFKESGTWKEKFGTWEEVCEDYLGMSKRTVDRHIAKSKTLQSKVSNLGQVVPSENNLSKGSCASTGQSPTLSLNGKPGPDSEVPTKRTESGKPKQELSIWRELLEKVCGLGLNRTNDLNHICPNPERHKRLRATFQSAWEQVEEWRRDTK